MRIAIRTRNLEDDSVYYKLLTELSKKHGLCLRFNYRTDSVEASKYIDTYESYEQAYLVLSKMFEESENEEE
jgi:adenylosuccinate synthase